MIVPSVVYDPLINFNRSPTISLFSRIVFSFYCVLTSGTCQNNLIFDIKICWAPPINFLVYYFKSRRIIRSIYNLWDRILLTLLAAAAPLSCCGIFKSKCWNILQVSGNIQEAWHKTIKLSVEFPLRVPRFCLWGTFCGNSTESSIVLFLSNFHRKFHDFHLVSVELFVEISPWNFHGEKSSYTLHSRLPRSGSSTGGCAAAVTKRQPVSIKFNLIWKWDATWS